MANKCYRDLIVWQRSMILVEEIYAMSKSFPKDELYGLTSQLRRSAISIPSNIAEGEGRKSENEFKRFLYIAKGSLCELETQVIIAEKLNYLNSKQLNFILSLSDEIGRLVSGLISSISKH